MLDKRLFALDNQGLVELIKIDGLLESKHMFISKVAHKRFCYGLFRVPASLLSVEGKYIRVTLASEDCFDDFHPGDTGDVRHHVVQKQVHLLKRFLHMLNV